MKKIGEYLLIVAWILAFIVAIIHTFERDKALQSLILIWVLLIFAHLKVNSDE